MRLEKEILADIECLAEKPGFAHVIAMICFRDNFIPYNNELTSAEYEKLFSWSRLIRTEISTLIGYMIKGDVDLTLNNEEAVESVVEKVDGLFFELHEILAAEIIPDFHAGLKGEIKNPFASAKGMREPIFYGGESAYSFQYRDFAPIKYANDRRWLLQNAGFDADEAKTIIQCIHDNCKTKTRFFIEKLQSGRLLETDLIEIFSFQLDELAIITLT